MWSEWYCTDSDCCQYIHEDGTKYEMIQAVWLDRTSEDKHKGITEYCIVRGMVDLEDYTNEEIEIYLSPYSFVEKPDNQIIVECILEQVLIADAYVIADAKTFEEAETIIKNLIGVNKND